MNAHGPVLGLVTARGGSKGVPRKNVRDLGGRPLIARSIEVALASRWIDRVVVSTDDDEIMAASRVAGAEVPFRRPAELSGDASPHIDVVVHAIEHVRASGYDPEYVLLLQPTSPFRTVADIDASVAIAHAGSAEAVVSVTESPHHPVLCRTIDAAGRLQKLVTTGPAYPRRQDLPDIYALNGAIFLCKTQVLLEQRTFYPEDTHAYVMPASRSLEIDTLWDWHLAEALLAHPYPEDSP